MKRIQPFMRKAAKHLTRTSVRYENTRFGEMDELKKLN